MIRITFAILLLLMNGIALAANPDEMLKDPILETRAKSIGQNLRCLVCQNQSIEESDADLARDLRILVRELLVAGNSDDDVIQFVVQRYGDFVLLKPPFKAVTIALWLGPVILIGIAGFAAFRIFRRKHSVVEQNVTLTATELAQPKNFND